MHGAAVCSWRASAAYLLRSDCRGMKDATFCPNAKSEAPRAAGGSSNLSTRAAEPAEVFGDRVSMLAGLLPHFTWHQTELPEGVRIELAGPLTIEEAPGL